MYKSEERASVHCNTPGSGASSQITMLRIIVPPPTYISVLYANAEVEQHCHESNTSIQSRREDIVVPLPPFLPVSEHEKVEDCAHQDPRIVIDGSRRRHAGRGSQEDGQVDQGNPTVAGEFPVEGPDDERTN